MPFKRSTKIICTIGPASIQPEILKKLELRGADYVRINLSHTKTEDIEKWIKDIQTTTKVPLILDTDGPQLRTGFIGKNPLFFEIGKELRVYDVMLPCNNDQIYLRPQGFLEYLAPGDLISIDFDNFLLTVTDTSTIKDHYVTCKVIVGGSFGNNKAVTVENKGILLPTYSEKDLIAIELAKKYNINIFTLSFMGCKEDVIEFKKLHPGAKAIAKIETRRGIENLEEIIDVSDGVLIDRGDLSREIPLEKVALAQRIIIRKCNAKGKPVYIATNVLDSMTENIKPTRAEINDVSASIIDGVNGFVLAKETSIGKHPVETFTFLSKLCEHVEATKNSGDIVELLNGSTNSSILIEPHGGTLVNRIVKTEPTKEYVDSLYKIKVDETVLMDAEQISIGTYSPLRGFMIKSEMNSVLDNMRLPNGLVWTVPIILQTDEKIARKIEQSQSIVLVDGKNDPYVILHVNEIFKLDKEEFCKKLYGTITEEHPGVKNIFSGGDYVIGGDIQLIKRLPRKHKQYELTPLQARQIFEKRGWSTVIGFHTRNVPHRSHEYIQIEGMRRANADGIFLHPVIGKKKAGDFTSEAIIQGYKLMEEKFYPKGKVVFATYATFSRYAGPREAIFTALCRKNFGCSHFIVGRDHTGVGKFYSPHESHIIFDKFPDLGIIPVRFDEVVYCDKCKEHIERKLCPHEGTYHKHISGTEAREMLRSGQKLPEWFLRAELSEMLLKNQKDREKIFVE